MSAGVGGRRQVSAGVGRRRQAGRGSVDHERVRLHRSGRVVERVGVLRGLALQLALIRQRTSTTITEKSEIIHKYNIKLFI